MANLVLAAVFFTLLHAGVSGTRLRDALVARLGEATFRGLFSAASFIGLVWLSTAYGAAPYGLLWVAPSWVRWAAAVVVLAAFVLAVLGLVTPNPAAVGGERALRADQPVRGVLRVTRHPFLWGVALWAAAHLAVSGQSRAVVLFGTLLLVALNGTRSIDRKRGRLLGDAWRRYEAMTSSVPFAAIAAGRTRFVPGEIGLGRVGLAAVVYAGMMLVHPILFGVVPWP